MVQYFDKNGRLKQIAIQRLLFKPICFKLNQPTITL